MGGYWLQSPSITTTQLLSINQLCQLSVCAFPVYLFWPFYPALFSLSLTHSLHLLYHISDIRTWLSVDFIASEASFHLLCCLAFTPSFSLFLFRSLSSFSYLSDCICWTNPQQKMILQNSGCCCQRDSCPRKSDLFIHALFPAIQIKSEKNITLCQKNSRLKHIKTDTHTKSGHKIPAALSSQGVPFQTSLSQYLTAELRVKGPLIRGVATSWLLFSAGTRNTVCAMGS